MQFWFDSCDRPSHLKLDSNRRFFIPCDLEISWMTSKNIRTLLLYYVKICASVNSNWSCSPETFNWGRNSWYFVPCDLEIWLMTLKNNRAPLLYYIKLCASFQSHGWIQTGVKSPETLNSGPNRQFFVPCDLEIWRVILKINRAPLPCYSKLCVWFHSHW